MLVLQYLAYIAGVLIAVIGIAVKGKPMEGIMIRPWQVQLGPDCLFVWYDNIINLSFRRNAGLN